LRQFAANPLGQNHRGREAYGVSVELGLQVTVYCQRKLTANDYGRDHHPRCFTMWLAGAGVKPGITFGETDEYCYNIVKNPVHVHDLHATILHCLGIDHTKLTYKFQGRAFRLTDVHGNVVKEILA
jgi:hypothetical protein